MNIVKTIVPNVAHLLQDKDGRYFLGLEQSRFGSDGMCHLDLSKQGPNHFGHLLDQVFVSGYEEAELEGGAVAIEYRGKEVDIYERDAVFIGDLIGVKRIELPIILKASHALKIADELSRVGVSDEKAKPRDPWEYVSNVTTKLMENMNSR